MLVRAHGTGINIDKGQISESCLETDSSKSRPRLAATIPFPIEETTPPVTKMYLVDIHAPFHKTIRSSNLKVTGILSRGGIFIICLKKKNSSLKTGSSDL